MRDFGYRSPAEIARLRVDWVLMLVYESAQQAAESKKDSGDQGPGPGVTDMRKASTPEIERALNGIGS